MQHIIPFYLFFCVAGGIAALVLLFLLYSKNPRKDLFYFSLFFVAMTCNIFTNLVLIYRSINITGIFGLEDYLLALAGGSFSIVFFSAGPMAVHRILAVPYEKWGNRILIVINIVAFIIQYFPTGISYDVSEGILIIGPLYTVTALTQLAIIVYIIILLLAGFHRIQDKVVRSLLFRCGIVTLLFMPGFIHDITYSMSNDHFNIFPVDMVFSPLYYLFLAVMVIIYAGRYLIEIKLLEKAVQPIAEFFSDFGEKHGLTDREKEVIPLIVEGMGNKQIANQLCISTKTVNNHIYNLYQKLKINTRFELLAMIRWEKDGGEKTTGKHFPYK